MYTILYIVKNESYMNMKVQHEKLKTLHKKKICD